jgi:predicted RNA binding protein YcfA (HicA-like mRNA interferase family)
LQEAGWILRRVAGSHRIFSRPDRSDIITVPVHGNKTLKIGTQRAIMKQAGLTEDNL